MFRLLLRVGVLTFVVTFGIALALKWLENENAKAEIPAGAVATVGTAVISEQDLDRWIANTARSEKRLSRVLEPPDFTVCVATLEERARKGKGGSGEPKAQCEQRYEELEQGAMEYLIRAQWDQQQAKAEGVEVDERELSEVFEHRARERKDYPKGVPFEEAVLEMTGMTVADNVFQLKLGDLSTKMTQKLLGDYGQIPPREAKAYYAKHRERFSKPARRDVDLVLTRTRSAAVAARRSLAAGAGFREVSRKYSIDKASRSKGGRLPDIAKGDQDMVFEEAVFGARKGVLEGPVETLLGWAVFRVVEVEPAGTPPFEEIKAEVYAKVRTGPMLNRVEKALDGNKTEAWKRTTCREGYEVELCSQIAR